MDIIKIKAEVYQLEQRGKRLPILHYLQDVWQQEPQSEGLTVLALRQMVAYADTVVQFSENSPLWEAKNEYSLYKAFLLDIISWGLKNYRTSKQFLWQMCFYLNPEYTYYYMYGREITDDNAVEWKKTLFQEAAQLYPDSLLFKCIDPIECMDIGGWTDLRKKRKRRFAWNSRNGICRRMSWITKLCGFLTTICFMRGFSDKFCGE